MRVCIVVNIVYDKDSGRSRGFGFVNFSEEDDAKCAKDAMDGKVTLDFKFFTYQSLLFESVF